MPSLDKNSHTEQENFQTDVVSDEIFIQKDIREKYPFLINYFSKGIESSDRNIAHCILFYGTDLDAQYSLALEVARMLNCTGTRTPECECLNCKWIRENKHPAVITVSRLEHKAPEDEGKAGINITINQARMIKNDLLVMSDYHRVLILCDRDRDGNIAGINEVNFPEATANALLKTFEEPPAKTTFFFITKDKSDVISTIVSRAQSFFVPSLKDEPRDFSLVKDAVENYLEFERGEVLDFNDKILALVKENNPMEVFVQIQNYMTELLKTNSYNKLLTIKLIKDINSVEKAKKEFLLNMNIQTVVENLAFALVLGE